MKNVIRNRPLENRSKLGHSVAKIEVDLAMHSSANRSTHIAHIFISPLVKAFAAENVKSIWSAIAILGNIPVVVYNVCDRHKLY